MGLSSVVIFIADMITNTESIESMIQVHLTGGIARYQRQKGIHGLVWFGYPTRL